MVKVRPRVKALRHLKLRQLGDAEFYLDIAALGNFMRIVDGFGRVRKKSPHLLLGLAVKLTAFITHPVLVRYLFACLNAQKDIVRLRVLRIGVMNVVGRNKVDPKLLAHTHKLLID